MSAPILMKSTVRLGVARSRQVRQLAADLSLEPESLAEILLHAGLCALALNRLGSLPPSRSEALDRLAQVRLTVTRDGVARELSDEQLRGIQVACRRALGLPT